MAFPSDSSGHELRYKFYKGAHGHKDVSLIDFAGNGSLAIFDGFIAA